MTSSPSATLSRLLMVSDESVSPLAVPFGAVVMFCEVANAFASTLMASPGVIAASATTQFALFVVEPLREYQCSSNVQLPLP
jgi:hypothetical protein